MSSTIPLSQTQLNFNSSVWVSHRGMSSEMTQTEFEMLRGLFTSPDVVMQSTAYCLCLAGHSTDSSNSANPSLSPQPSGHTYLTFCISYSKKQLYHLFHPLKAETWDTCLPPPSDFYPKLKSDQFHLPGS